MWRKLESYKRNLGYELVAGIDEVGRGALAGPLVAAALILKPYVKLGGLKDSKALNVKSRNKFSEKIINGALDYSFGLVTPKEIDKIGISKANDLAFLRALQGLKIKPNYVLADYFSIYSYSCPVEGVLGGDRDVRVIAASSVIAKVYRDALMKVADKKYPRYGFIDHVGYGTETHRRAIKKLGLCPLHRRSFTYKTLNN